MEKMIQVTENYSISEEKFMRLVNAMKQYWDELGGLTSIFITDEDMNLAKELEGISKREELQALAIILMNSFTEGCIASINDSAILSGDRLSESEIETMRNQARQALTQLIFNHV